MSTLNTCGCCAETPELSPIYNRPGLNAIEYRIGVYGSFLERLLESIYSVQVPTGPKAGAQPLAALTTRATDDVSIALLDAWAVIADVLTFYQERIANEGYLRTATERRSILELAREIGYELAPGVASNVLLQFTVDNIVAPPPPGGPAPASSPLNAGTVTIPAGTQVQSIPAANQQPQLFETTADFTAYVERNQLRPRLQRTPDLALFNGKLFLLGTNSHFQSGKFVKLPAAQVYPLNPATVIDPSLTDIPAVEMNEIYLQGISTNISQGDRVLLAGLRGTTVRTDAFIVNSVTTDSTSNTTLVTFTGSRLAAPTFEAANPPVADLGSKHLSLTEANVAANILNARVSETDLQAFLQYNSWDPAQLEALVNNPPAPKTGKSGAFVFRTKCGFFGNNAPLWDSLPQPKTSQRADAYPHSWDAWNGGRGSVIWTNSQAHSNSPADVYLERTVPQILPDSWAYFEDPGTPSTAYQITGITEKALADYCISGRATGLKLEISAQTRGTSVGSPAVIAASTNQVDAFAIGVDGHLYHRWRDSSNNWQGPKNLGGTSLKNAPSAVSWGPDRIDVFAISSTGHLFHWWTDGNNQWSGPENRGGGKLAGSPSTASREANSLDVTAIGTDGNLYHAHYDNHAWAGPDNRGGGNLKNSPSIISLGAGGIAIFALATDGDLYQTIWVSPGLVVGPQPMLLGLGQGLLVDSPSAVRLVTGAIYIANRISNGDIFVYSDDSVLWTDAGLWTLAVIFKGSFIGSPVLVTDAVTIQFFAIGANGDLYNLAWLPSPFPFQQATLRSLGGSGNLIGSPAAFSRTLGNFEALAVDATGHWEFTSLGASGWDPLKDLGNGTLVAFHTRTATAFVQSAQIPLAGIPVTDHIGKGTQSIMMNSLVIGLENGQPIALSGTRSDAPSVSAVELHHISKIEHNRGYTTLTFQEKLQFSYIRSTLTMSANVTAATNGGATTEVLGNGDGSKSNQSFTLKKSPLTYVAAPTSTGVASTLHVSVNNNAWKEVPTLYGLTSSDQDYTVRLGDDGAVTVGFGEPASRLKSGQQNVRAKYRTQIGLAGNAAAGSITTLMSRPPGLRGVVNPLPATGGADPQKLSHARANAPLTVLTLERVVSLTDYESFATAFAGVGKAQAIAVWSGETHIVYLTVAASDGTSIKAGTSLYDTLIGAINNLKDPVQIFRVAGFQSLAFSLQSALLIDKVNFTTADVQAAAVKTLTRTFAFSKRAFAQSVTEAEIVTLIQSVPGVLACNLTQLYVTGDPTGPQQKTPPPFLAASPARWESGAIQPAQLLLLHSSGITFTEMKP